MKKTLPILIIASSALAICAGIVTAVNKGFDLLSADVNLVEGKIEIDYQNVTVTDTDGTLGFFDINASTKSGFPVSVSDCYVYGNTVTFKQPKEPDGDTYMFYTTGTYQGDSGFQMDIYISDFYSFTSVVIDGLFTNSSGTIYRRTYTISDPGDKTKKVVTVEDGIAELDIASWNMDDNYINAAIKSITINYSCVA